MNSRTGCPRPRTSADPQSTPAFIPRRVNFAYANFRTRPLADPRSTLAFIPTYQSTPANTPTYSSTLPCEHLHANARAQDRQRAPPSTPANIPTCVNFAKLVLMDSAPHQPLQTYAHIRQIGLQRIRPPNFCKHIHILVRLALREFGPKSSPANIPTRSSTSPEVDSKQN